MNIEQPINSDIRAPRVPEMATLEGATPKQRSQEHVNGEKIQKAMAELFAAAAVRPDLWEKAISSLAPRRPTQARRAFRDFMHWDEETRLQAMAALEGAIAWAKDGNFDLLKTIHEEFPLSPRVAHALFSIWEPGDIGVIRGSYNQWRDAVNVLVNKYQRLAYKLANQFANKGDEEGVWVSQSFFALIKAAELYEPGRAEFMTFAYTWIRGELRKASEHEAERKKLTPSMSDTHNECKRPENGAEEFFVGLVPGPNMQFVEVNQRKEVSSAMDLLSDRERVVVRRLFGMDGEEMELTAEEISKDLGVSRGRIYQIKTQALSKMQHAAA